MGQDFYDSHEAGYEWGTPRWVVKPLSDALNGFDLDPASGAEPEPYADERYTIYDNGLAKEWFGDVWLNPPYGPDHNEKWAKKTEREIMLRALQRWFLHQRTLIGFNGIIPTQTCLHSSMVVYRSWVLETTQLRSHL